MGFSILYTSKCSECLPCICRYSLWCLDSIHKVLPDILYDSLGSLCKQHYYSFCYRIFYPFKKIRKHFIWYTPEKLALCIISGDEKALTAAPGIGKKLAQRILLEMKDKMSKDQLEAASGASGVVMPELAAPGGAMEDALAALAVLGYPRAVAVNALQGVDTAGLATDEIVRAALKRLF